MIRPSPGLAVGIGGAGRVRYRPISRTSRLTKSAGSSFPRATNASLVALIGLSPVSIVAAPHAATRIRTRDPAGPLVPDRVARLKEVLVGRSRHRLEVVVRRPHLSTTRYRHGLEKAKVILHVGLAVARVEAGQHERPERDLSPDDVGSRGEEIRSVEVAAGARIAVIVRHGRPRVFGENGTRVRLERLVEQRGELGEPRTRRVLDVDVCRDERVLVVPDLARSSDSAVSSAALLRA